MHHHQPKVFERSTPFKQPEMLMSQEESVNPNFEKGNGFKLINVNFNCEPPKDARSIRMLPEWDELRKVLDMVAAGPVDRWINIEFSAERMTRRASSITSDHANRLRSKAYGWRFRTHIPSSNKKLIYICKTVVEPKK